MDWSTVLLLGIALVAGAFVQSSISFGMAVVAAAFIIVVAPDLMPGSLLVTSFSLPVVQLVHGARDIAWRPLSWALAAFFLAGATMAVAGLAVAGEFTREQLWAGLAWIPFMGAGYAVAAPLRARLDQQRLRRAVLAFCVVAGVSVIVRALVF